MWLIMNYNYYMTQFKWEKKEEKITLIHHAVEKKNKLHALLQQPVNMDCLRDAKTIIYIYS